MEIFDLGEPVPLWDKELEPHSKDKPEWLKSQMLQFQTRPNYIRFEGNWKGVRMLGEGYAILFSVICEVFKTNEIIVEKGK